MGLNAFFCTCFISGAYFAGVDLIGGYHFGMVIVFLSGIVFLILSLTGAREYIAKAMPECLKKSIPVGIGLFIAFIGFKNAGLITANQYTFVQFVDVNGTFGAEGVTAVDAWRSIAPAIIAFLGLVIITVLTKLNVKGAVLIGVLGSAVLYYVATWQVPVFDMSSIGQAFSDFGEVGITGLFDAEAWDLAFNGKHIGGIFSAIVLIISFCVVDMSDMRSAVPAFLTLIMMPLTYSISNGIGIGCISYVLITLFTGKYTKKDIIATLIALIFIAKFAFVTM